MRYRKKSALMLGLSLCCLVSILSPLSAQIVVEQKGSDQPWIYHMTVDPAGATSPALRYRLIRGGRERKPGNAASHYYRALTLLQEQEKFGKRLQEIIEEVEKLGKENRQLSGFPVDKVREFLGHCGPILKEIESGVACEKCDWGVDVQSLSTREAIELRLPEIQNSRTLARIVMLKARLAIVDRNYDDAFSAIQMGFQLGHDVGKFPTLISSLVGIAITSISTQPLMELISEPNAPNFYWATASVPKPFIDLIPPLEHECNWALKIPLLEEAEKSHTPEEWKRLLSETFQLIQQLKGDSSLNSQDGSDSNTQIDLLQWILREYPRAKEELTLLGFTPEQVEAMPVIQVVALHDARLIPFKRDELLCWSYLSYAQAKESLDRIESRRETPAGARSATDLNESLGLFGMLHPAVGLVAEAVARMDRRMVRIRAIEGLRIHAAANGNRFPSSLDEVKLVPIPSDPITGKPILYRLEGKTAVLEFPPPGPRNIGSHGETIRLTLRNAP